VEGTASLGAKKNQSGGGQRVLSGAGGPRRWFRWLHGRTRSVMHPRQIGGFVTKNKDHRNRSAGDQGIKPKTEARVGQQKRGKLEGEGWVRGGAVQQQERVPGE